MENSLLDIRFHSGRVFPVSSNVLYLGVRRLKQGLPSVPSLAPLGLHQTPNPHSVRMKEPTDSRLAYLPTRGLSSTAYLPAAELIRLPRLWLLFDFQWYFPATGQLPLLSSGFCSSVEFKGGPINLRRDPKSGSSVERRNSSPQRSWWRRRDPREHPEPRSWRNSLQSSEAWSQAARPKHQPAPHGVSA